MGKAPTLNGTASLSGRQATACTGAAPSANRPPVCCSCPQVSCSVNNVCPGGTTNTSNAAARLPPVLQLVLADAVPAVVQVG
jgi:hypothetical protein